MIQMRKRFLDICAEELDNVAGAELIEQTEAEVKYLEEEAIKQEMNIAQDIAAIEELTEDINVIQDQLGENDKKLTDPDIVVTAVDVEVSEECYKALAFKHGIRNINAIRFSSESVLDSVKAEPRRYLSMSNEGLKDIFIKIWEKIKAFFKKIGEKLGLAEKAATVKSKQATKKAKETSDSLKNKPDFSVKDAIKNKIKDIKANISTEEFKWAFENNNDDFVNVIGATAVNAPWVLMGLATPALFENLISEHGALKGVKQFEQTANDIFNHILEIKEIDDFKVYMRQLHGSTNAGLPYISACTFGLIPVKQMYRETENNPPQDFIDDTLYAYPVLASNNGIVEIGYARWKDGKDGDGDGIEFLAGKLRPQTNAVIKVLENDLNDVNKAKIQNYIDKLIKLENTNVYNESKKIFLKIANSFNPNNIPFDGAYERKTFTTHLSIFNYISKLAVFYAKYIISISNNRKIYSEFLNRIERAM